ncbi:MAG: hypothetical protein AB8B50_08900 [Pirellulaceae bacterium]
MEQIRKQTKIARRRMTSERFLSYLPWTLSVAFVVAAIGLALPKLMHLEVDPTIWIASWAGGVSVVALITNFCLTFVGRPTKADAAVAIDQRFQLRERLSSSLVLTKEDRESELGAALVEDANRRAEKIDARDKFTWGFNRSLLIPVLPALLAAAICYLPSKAAPEVVAKKDETSITQVKNSTKPLLEQIRKKRKMAEDKGLNAAVDMFKKLEGELAKLQKNAKLDTKQTLAKLNDIKKQLAERREELGTSEALRKNLSGLEKFDDGPGEKLANALKKGDFEEAEESMKDLLKKMENGEMDKAGMQKLEKQLEKLQQAMSEAAQNHEQAKQDLKEQIAQAQESGDMQQAAQLQRKLEQMQAGDANMAQMQQLSDMLQKAQQSMQSGDMQQAQESLQEMADQLQQMNQSDSELQDLDELMDSLAQSKSQMACKQCDGAGCQSCMMGGMPGQIPGQGMGEGAGSGDRPEEENEVDFFDSQVREQMKKGEIIYGGLVGGQNKKGIAKADVQEAVLTSMAEEPEPLDETPLPKMQKEHARGYFNAIREGN